MSTEFASLTHLRMVLGESEDADNRNDSAHDEAKDCPEWRARNLLEHHNADDHRDKWVNHGESRNHEIWWTRRVRVLHEAHTDEGASDQRGKYQPGQPVKLPLLKTLNDSFRKGCNKPVDCAGANDVNERDCLVPKQQEQEPKGRHHDCEEHQQRDELGLRHRHARCRERRNQHEDSDPDHAHRDRDPGSVVRLHAGHFGVEHRGNHHGHNSEGLHHDERREGQTEELKHDSQTKQQRANHPRWATDELSKVTKVQACSGFSAGNSLNLNEPAGLILRAVRQKNCPDECNRNSPKLSRIELCRSSRQFLDQREHTSTVVPEPLDKLVGMPVRPICISGEPVLHSVAEPVTAFDANLASLVSDMFDTMDLAPGVGLAAPQIGVSKRVFVWSYEAQDQAPARGVAINPELWLSPVSPGDPDELEDVEGCLSFPGERFPVRRAERVILRAIDLDQKSFEYELSGWFARIMQHEFDHLDGILYVNRLVEPFHKAALKAERKHQWGRPGLSWMPGVDHLEG